MERLGDKLKQIEAVILSERAAQDNAARAAAAEVERQRRDAVRDQFASWKRDIALAINQGKVPPTIIVAGPPIPIGGTGYLISSPQGRDHDLFDDCNQWAAQQGLRIYVSHADRRGGGGALLKIMSGG